MISITRKKPTYESGIEKDGVQLVLFPASKNTFSEIIETAAEFQNSGNAWDKVNEMYRLLAVILGNNTAGITVNAEELAEIDPMTAAAIIREYTTFMRGLHNNPN